MSWGQLDRSPAAPAFDCSEGTRASPSDTQTAGRRGEGLVLKAHLCMHAII